ncbi:MAG: hypothetical protein M3Y50_11830 [Acidobacteriota bacterium]|nr:hypothetical protein [Acidobacteriota bacterium]
MQTKALMTCSAIAMFVFGISLTFAPRELLSYTGSTAQPLTLVIVQAAGALYLGFAMLNWMAKDNLIGGIYSRPVALGNLVHFFMVAITIIKTVIAGHHEAAVFVVAFLYCLFAVLFALVVFGSPSRHARA